MDWTGLRSPYGALVCTLRTAEISSEPLFGCCNNTAICCYGCFCTACLFAQNAKQIDESAPCPQCCAYCALSFCWLCWVVHKPKRELLRKRYQLVEQQTDLFATCCCGPCAVCQEAKEIKDRGLPTAQAIVITGQPSTRVMK
ncbi:unnamed protein product [Didymodactylos carnosus]|uniref:Uncharacterized protein n=1 Tax=Didymodactylos carnosus TaxID=1234261 RepID=A0A8S2F8W4_9BILA|nr:unnamed protein product [Didymodactylos carnosus]CAF4185624.1 unnamed protein product [Didymodactylos carnosus]